MCEVHVCWELLFIWLAELTALLDVSLCVWGDPDPGTEVQEQSGFLAVEVLGCSAVTPAPERMKRIGMGTFACTTLQHLILRDSVGLTWFDYVWLFSWQCFPSSPATHTVVADRSSLESQVLEKRPSWKDWHDASLMEMCRRPWRTRRWANQLAVGQHFATLKHGIAWPRPWQTGIYWNNMNEYFEFYIFELWVNRSLFTNITHTHTYILCIYVCFFAWNSWRASNVLSI